MWKREPISVSCELCNNVVRWHLVWEPLPSSQELPDQLRGEAEAELRHSHWVKYHRVCAVCGLQVEDPATFTPNTNELKVHPNYRGVAADGTYFSIEPQLPPHSRLLRVHQKCNPESKG
jgi:hypothetical protein